MSEKKRMAGDELEKNTPESKGAKAAVIEAKDKNYDARLRRFEDEERREEKLGVVDREKYDLKGYSDKDIFMSFKGDDFGDKDYERLTGKSIGGDDKKPTATPTQPDKEPTASIQPVPTVNQPTEEKPDVTFPSATGPGGPQSVYQDNDINSSVNGNDNNVNIDQDNSVRQYGGTNKKAEMGATNLMDNYVLNLRKSRQAG